MERPAHLLSPANILVLAPSRDQVSGGVCSDYLSFTDSEQERVLLVSLTQAPDDRLCVWREQVGDRSPADVAVITARGSSPTSTRRVGESAGIDAANLTIESVDSPGNLTQLGVRITNVLSEWPDSQIIVCFQSVTTLLQYVDADQAFQFLHTLTQYVRNVDGIAHFHMDPDAHDDQVVSTLQPVFDTVVDHRDDGPTSFAAEPGQETTPAESSDLEAESRRLEVAIGEDERPSHAVVRTLAKARGAAVESVDSPLLDGVEIDALDDMLSPQLPPQLRGVQVQFTYRDYEVTVDGETVSVAPAIERPFRRSRARDCSHGPG